MGNYRIVAYHYETRTEYRIRNRLKGGFMVTEKKEKKQRYKLDYIEKHISKLGDKAKGLDSEEKLNLALNAMLDGKKIVGTTIRKGINYFILEAE